MCAWGKQTKPNQKKENTTTTTTNLCGAWICFIQFNRQPLLNNQPEENTKKRYSFNLDPHIIVDKHIKKNKKRTNSTVIINTIAAVTVRRVFYLHKIYSNLAPEQIRRSKRERERNKTIKKRDRQRITSELCEFMRVKKNPVEI